MFILTGQCSISISNSLVTPPKTVSILEVIGGFMYLAVTGKSVNPNNHFLSKRKEIISWAFNEYNFNNEELLNWEGKNELEDEIDELVKV